MALSKLFVDRHDTTNYALNVSLYLFEIIYCTKTVSGVKASFQH